VALVLGTRSTAWHPGSLACAVVTIPGAAKGVAQRVRRRGGAAVGTVARPLKKVGACCATEWNRLPAAESPDGSRCHFNPSRCKPGSYARTPVLIQINLGGPGERNASVLYLAPAESSGLKQSFRAHAFPKTLPLRSLVLAGLHCAAVALPWRAPRRNRCQTLIEGNCAIVTTRKHKGVPRSDGAQFDPSEPEEFAMWVTVHARVAAGEMPPKKHESRGKAVASLSSSSTRATAP